MFKTCRRFDVSLDFIVKLKDNDVQDSRNVVMFLTFFIFYLKFLDKILLKIIPRNFKKLKKKRSKSDNVSTFSTFWQKSKDKYVRECRVNALVKIC